MSRLNMPESVMLCEVRLITFTSQVNGSGARRVEENSIVS
jgi:hypothetical protein